MEKFKVIIVEDVPFEENETNAGQNSIDNMVGTDDNIFGSDDDEMAKLLAEMNSLAH